MQYSELTRLYHGDQGNVTFLKEMVADSGGEFDIIIDDGSHDPRHQMISFDELFPTLRPGGLYIFEDVETSYWNQIGAGLYERKFEQPLGRGSGNSVIEKFKDVIDDSRHIMNVFVGPKSREKRAVEREGRKMIHEHDIAEVSFAQNLIIVRKKEDSDDWFYDHVRRGEYMHVKETY